MVLVCLFLLLFSLFLINLDCYLKLSSQVFFLSFCRIHIKKQHFYKLLLRGFYKKNPEKHLQIFQSLLYVSKECRKKLTCGLEQHRMCGAGEPVLRQTPPQSYSARVVPRTHVVPRSCFAQDVGSYKAYAVCTCNLTLTSRIYRHTDVGGTPIGSQTGCLRRRWQGWGVWGEASASLPPE